MTAAYVLRRRSDGRFVAPPGQKHSYTRHLDEARVFPTVEAARREAGGGEALTVVNRATLQYAQPTTQEEEW